MHTNFYTYEEKGVDDRLSKEIGMKFKLQNDCKINDLNFNITSNEFSSLKFRLNIYENRKWLSYRTYCSKRYNF